MKRKNRKDRKKIRRMVACSALQARLDNNNRGRELTTKDRTRMLDERLTLRLRIGLE